MNYYEKMFKLRKASKKLLKKFDNTLNMKYLRKNEKVIRIMQDEYLKEHKVAIL